MKPKFQSSNEKDSFEPKLKTGSKKFLNSCEQHESQEINSFCTISHCRALMCPSCYKSHPHKKKEDFSEDLLTKFRFLSFLGKGSCGKVFAVQQNFEDFAIKVVDVFEDVEENFSVQQKQIFFEKNMNEVEIHQVLRQQYIICYYDHFYIESEERLVIKMELADSSLGMTFQELDKDQALVWFAQICSGMNYLHEKNIIHRDLKPGNVLIKENKIKICDFGGAKLLDQTRTSTLRKNKELFLGTQEYLAPEIFSQDVKKFTKSTDIWALGIILFKMMNQGRHLFLLNGEKMDRDDKIEQINNKMDEYKHHPENVENMLKEIYMGDVIGECLKYEANNRIDIKKLMDLVQQKLDEAGIKLSSFLSNLKLKGEISNENYKKNNSNKMISNTIIKPELTRVLQPNDSTKAKLKKFMEWIQTTKIKANKIEIVYYENLGLGVQAIDDLKTDEIILTVPNEYIITLETAENHNDFKNKSDFNNIQFLGPKHTSFAAFLLLNRKMDKNSKWKSYFDMLPSKMMTNPLLYEHNELEFLKGTDFLKKIHKQKQALKADYDQLLVNMPEYSIFSFEDFCNNRLIVASRIFGYKYKGKKTYGLIPYGDFINPGIKNVNWIYDDEKEAFVFKVFKNITKGEAIKVTFGKKCNTRFLTNYGYIEQNNFLENELEIQINIIGDTQDPLLKIKRENFEIPEEKYLILKLKWDSTLFLEILGKIRIILVDNEQNLFKLAQHRTGGFVLEKKVIEYLQAALKQRMQDYPTSYQEDEILLNKLLNINEINCLIARMGEKEIINSFLDLLVELQTNVLCYLGINGIDFDIDNYEFYISSCFYKKFK